MLINHYALEQWALQSLQTLQEFCDDAQRKTMRRPDRAVRMSGANDHE